MKAAQTPVRVARRDEDHGPGRADFEKGETDGTADALALLRAGCSLVHADSVMRRLFNLKVCQRHAELTVLRSAPLTLGKRKTH
jgi:hypothetical protein